MTFGTDWGWGADKDESRRMFDAYAEAGGNLLDTANVYTQGTSEEYIGEFISPDRERWVVATKYSLAALRPDEPNASGNQKKNMVQALEQSLRRLRTDYVDLFWVHAWDFTTPVEEVMRGLDDLVRQGKVLYVGISDTPAWVVAQANTMAALRGWSPFVALQVRYSLIDRAAERDLLPMAREFDLGVTLWSVLGAGVLSGKYNHERPPAEGRAKAGAATVPRNLSIAGEVVSVAEEVGCTPSQVAISWAQQQRGVLIPLIGARNLPQLQENLRATRVKLEPEHLSRLDAMSEIELGFPHDFLGPGGTASQFIYGETLDRLDAHRGEIGS
jgi:aryl-alcohol dehydrogenase-like predicted oxidoreductase